MERKMKQYIVDAFTDQVFSGNSAAVCVLEKWLPEEMMIKIASENNLSETAFAVKENNEYQLRWFTPGGEIDLCGHATLAAAYVIMRFYDKEADCISFRTKSGLLSVKKNGNLYEMKFPAYTLKEVPVTEAMTEAMGARPQKAYLGRDLLCIFDSADVIVKMQPDMDKVKKLEGLLLQVTARGIETDCISRTFAPKLNVNEDPVCGSGHCHIVPYWTEVFGKKEIVAWQASKRGGVLYCRKEGENVFLSGNAVLFAQSDIYIES